MRIECYRGFEDEETTVLMADEILQQSKFATRDFPTENRKAGYRLAECVRNIDLSRKIHSITVFSNYIRVVPHGDYGLKPPAEIIISKTEGVPRPLSSTGAEITR